MATEYIQSIVGGKDVVHGIRPTISLMMCGPHGGSRGTGELTLTAAYKLRRDLDNALERIAERAGYTSPELVADRLERGIT